jgi:hypothetical protein
MKIMGNFGASRFVEVHVGFELPINTFSSDSCYVGRKR